MADPSLTPPEPFTAAVAAPDDERGKLVLTLVLAGIPLALWLIYVGTSIAMDHSKENPAVVGDWLKPLGVGSGACLATIAGAWLGFKPETGLTLTQRLRPRLSFAGWATYIYFGSLIVAGAVFILDSQREYAAELVRTSLATLLGFGLGAAKALAAPEK
jgi:hypothetical protein